MTYCDTSLLEEIWNLCGCSLAGSWTWWYWTSSLLDKSGSTQTTKGVQNRPTITSESRNQNWKSAKRFHVCRSRQFYGHGTAIIPVHPCSAVKSFWRYTVQIKLMESTGPWKWVVKLIGNRRSMRSRNKMTQLVKLLGHEYPSTNLGWMVLSNHWYQPSINIHQP